MTLEQAIYDAVQVWALDNDVEADTYDVPDSAAGSNRFRWLRRPDGSLKHEFLKADVASGL